MENQVPPAGDRDDRAGQLAGFDLGIQRGDYPTKSRGGHADRFRFRTRQRDAGGWAGRLFVCVGFGHVATPGSFGVHSRNLGKACRTKEAGSILRNDEAFLWRCVPARVTNEGNGPFRLPHGDQVGIGC